MTIDTIITQLLANRGLTDPAAIVDFFSPPHPEHISSPFDSQPGIQLIKQHFEANHRIAIYGDYDVDGLTSTAILWETLYQFSHLVFPHIPHRRDEGYGLSVKGLDHCLDQGAKLIITVDNGIVAHAAVDYCRSRGCDLIIIDHHEPEAKLPTANVILHSTATCAAGLTWFFCRDFLSSPPPLDLVAIAVVCDLVPLLGINRSFAKYGLVELNRTTRPGLLALFAEAGLRTTNHEPITLNSYHCGFIIGPRLNSMGRLEHALDSLRLLCTSDSIRAASLAVLLGDTNRSRQNLTQSAVDLALSRISSSEITQILAVADPTFDEGVVGLVAAKLVEKFHHPSLAISVGPDISKGSARSVPGFHITDYLRSLSSVLTSVGGHAMAAGFSLPTGDLPGFISAVTKGPVGPDLLVKKHRIDAELPLSFLDLAFYHRLQTFAPFGLGNTQPVFLTSAVPLSNSRRMGKSFQHLKFTAGPFDAVYFNAPPDLQLPPTSDLIYSLDLNSFNGRTNLQLVVKKL